MVNSTQARKALEKDIHRHGVALNAQEWDHIVQRCKYVHVRAGDKIQNQAHVADCWIFLSDGIAASEQSWLDGASTIARFFEPGDICANLTSVWKRDIATDDLLAVTDVSGLALPDSIFRQQYLNGGFFGVYLRFKMMEAHLFAKELVCSKTLGQTETRYQFLEQHHRNVIGSVPQKDIARFLGITPQGLSRFLRRRKS
ncbi:MAG: hypothetical protein AAGA53_05835 [Pseudomonadota bacterium]